ANQVYNKIPASFAIHEYCALKRLYQLRRIGEKSLSYDDMARQMISTCNGRSPDNRNSLYKKQETY
ncbi:MAG: hypothetical protein WBP74_08170, partial [Nitrososphaeraceae archaeon]